MADIKKIIEDVKAMTVVELNDLVKAIEEEFGVSAAAMAVAAPVAGAAAPAFLKLFLSSVTWATVRPL